MNKTENISAKPARSIWFWCGGTLALLLLFVAIAIPIMQNHRAIKHVESLGGRVTTEPNFMFLFLPESWQKWLRSSLGDRIQSFETVTSIGWNDSSINDDDLRCLRMFANLKGLWISGTQISDAGLIHLKGLTNLIALVIINTQVSDAGLSHLKGLTGLESLYISKTPVTKEGVAQLQVSLPDCQIEYTSASP